MIDLPCTEDSKNAEPTFTKSRSEKPTAKYHNPLAQQNLNRLKKATATPKESMHDKQQIKK